MKYKQTFLGMRNKLRSRHTEYYDERKLQYLSQIAGFKRSVENGERDSRTARLDFVRYAWEEPGADTRLAFSAFHDPLRFNGRIPSGVLASCGVHVYLLARMCVC